MSAVKTLVNKVIHT